MTYKEYLLKRTTEQLKKELTGLADMIDNIGCFGTRDLIMREEIEQELNRRERKEINTI